LPEEPFEAAQVDGATAWQKLRYLTLPLLKPILVVAALLRITDAVKIFDIIYASTAGGPGIATETMNIYAFETVFTYMYIGYAAAMVLFMFLVSYTITTLFFRYSSVAEVG